MSEFSEAPQSEISSKITPEVIPQQPEQLPRRNFFTSILDKFKPRNESVKPQETQQEPQNHTKLDRRKFLIGAGATAASLALGGHLIRNVDAVNDVVVNQLLGRVNEALAVALSKDTDALLKYGQENIDYKGPIRFEVPKQTEIGNTTWTDGQLTRLKDIVSGNKELIDSIFGSPPEWTNNETVLMVKDFVSVLENRENKNYKAAFLDGDMLSKVVPLLSGNEILQKMDLILIPENILDQSDPNKPNYIGEADIAHEMTHAYNQDDDYLPVMIVEGLAQMMAFKKEIEYKKVERKQKFNETDSEAENYIFKFMKEMRQMELSYAQKIDTSKTFNELIKENPTAAGSYYVAAGINFLDWYKQHPDFFKEVRKKENVQYAQTQQKPTYDQWQEFGEQVVPGFKDWLNSNPLFTIKRS